MGQLRRSAERPEFSEHDLAVGHTLAINSALDHGQLARVPRVSTAFAPAFTTDEHMLAAGRFELAEFIAVGDGSYLHDGGFFFMTGAVGLALTAGTAMFRAAGNSSRRSKAVADATQQWRPVDDGLLTVSQHGFYLQSYQGLRPWSWPAIRGAQLVAPRTCEVFGDSDRGPVHWLLQSDWCELILTLWARTQHPHHPQFASGGWVPPGWGERASAAGYRGAAGQAHPHRAESSIALPAPTPPPPNPLHPNLPPVQPGG